MRFYRKIEGERVYLSPFDVEEAEIYTKWAEWMNDRGVADTFDGYQTMMSPGRARQLLEGLTGYRFAIVLAEGDALIGHVSLHDIDHRSRHAFLGIFIGDAACRGRGYGTEAVRLVVDFGFRALNLRSIMLSVHADNAAGIACYKKVGFEKVGRRRDWVFKDGQYVDVLYMQLMGPGG